MDQVSRLQNCCEKGETTPRQRALNLKSVDDTPALLVASFVTRGAFFLAVLRSRQEQHPHRRPRGIPSSQKDLRPTAGTLLFPRWNIKWLIVVAGLALFFNPRCVFAEESLASPDAWNQCYRDRSLLTALTQALDQLKSGSTAEGVTLLQWVLERPYDSFYKTDEGLISAKSQAEQILESGPSEYYRLRYGAQAESLFLKAKSDGNRQALLSILQRFFLTDAGYHAAELLIVQWLDEGENDLAASLINHLRHHAGHSKRLSLSLRSRSEASPSTAAHRGTYSKNLDSFPDHSTPKRHHVLGEQQPTPENSLFRYGWMLPGGNQTRNAAIDGSAPLTSPIWVRSSRSFGDSGANEPLIANLENRQRDLDLPTRTALFPILVRNTVYYRYFQELRAVNALNGQFVWAYSCDAAGDRQDGPRDQEQTAHLIPDRAGSKKLRLEACFENSVEGMLSSDGRFLYVVSNPIEPSNPLQAHSLLVETEHASKLSRFYNRMMALYIDQPADAESRVAWIGDGLGSNILPRTTATSHVKFLGPPLPCATELLSVTEHANEIHLTALDPSSGSLNWSQPVCLLDRDELADPHSDFTASVIGCSQGIAVIPTGTGLIVAVDLVRRRLLWASLADDIHTVRQQDPFALRHRPKRMIQSESLGHDTFASNIAISGKRIIFLCPRAKQIQCLDLMTGKPLWSRPQRQGESVGNIIQGRVLVVGMLDCRCLSLDDGTDVWTTSTGPVAGRGLNLGNQYLLPLANGRLSLLDVADGREVGSILRTESLPLGNLIGDGKRIFSLSHRGLMAFGQSDNVTTELDSSAAVHRTEGERKLLQAKVDLARGQVIPAEQKLLACLTCPLTESQRTDARHHLKRLLLAKLNALDSPSLQDFDHLELLIDSPDERFQLLASRFQHLSKSADIRSRVDLIEQVYQLPSPATISPAGDNLWSFSPAVWNRLLKTPAEDLRQVIEDRRTDQTQGAGVSDLDELRRLVRAYDDLSFAEPIRAQLALKLETTGESQSAEILWLRNRMSDNASRAAEAAARLSELWERAGFLNEAAAQLESLATEYASTTFNEGSTGAQFVAGRSPNLPAQQAWQRSHSPRWNIDRVDIACTPSHTNIVIDPGLANSSAPRAERFSLEGSGDAARPLRMFTNQPCDFLLNPPQHGTDDQQSLIVYDRCTRLPRGTIRLPTVHAWPNNRNLSAMGHLIGLGSPGGAIGVSTLQLADGLPVWNQFPADLKNRQSPPIPGPSGPHFASFLWRNRLYVIDPMDGELLWQRILATDVQQTNHPAPLGLEVVGDHLALAVQSPDRSSFDVFETATGRILKSAKLGFESGQPSLTLGRHVVGIGNTQEGFQLQIYDLLKDLPEICEPIGEQTQLFPLGDGHLGIFSVNAKESNRCSIKVYDVLKCQKKLDASLDPVELSDRADVSLFADHRRYYINLRRFNVTTPKAFNGGQALVDSLLPGVTVHGDLYAFDGITSRLLWKRSLSPRTVLQFPGSHLPFLVTVRLVKNRQNSNLRSLTVEVLDGSTGETIGRGDNFPDDRLLTADYDGLNGRMILSGRLSDIELKFNANLQRIAP